MTNAHESGSAKSSAVPKSSVMLLVRLGIMMFLQFFIWGAWYVSMYGFLADNGMAAVGESGFSFDAAAYTVAPIAAIIAPLTLGLIADRLMNTERVLAILFLVGGGLLWFAPSFAAAGSPSNGFMQFLQPMILCLLLYMICFMPTLGLTASLSFKHLANGVKEFPVVRVLGTVGWIAGNWAMLGCRMATGEAATLNAAQLALEEAKVAQAAANAEAATDSTAIVDAATETFNQATAGLNFMDNSIHMFHVAAIASVILGVYCLTLPRTEPPAKGKPISVGRIFGIEAWAMLKDKAYFVFAAASFLICIPLAGYYAKGYGFVDAQGVSLFGSTTGAMSTGQMSEIFFMLIMPLAFARLGVKKMLMIGMLAWALRYGLWGYAFGQQGVLLTLPIFLGILLHGICYDFFFVAGMIYTDKKASPEIRGQAQSLIVMLTQGLGLGIGAQAFGWWTTQCTTGDAVDFARFWYAPAAFALVVMLFFAVAFWDRSTDNDVNSEVQEH